MKMLYALCFLTLLSCADELEMFDVIDNDSLNTATQNTSNIDMLIQISHLIQDKRSNESVFYGNISDNGQYYVYDLRLEANENTQALHIKDLYLKTSYAEHYFFELGRMNVKEGIAYGYNPTDYFKGGASFTLSLDPKERKENRLGAILVQASAILDTVTVKALYSPKISVDTTSIGANKEYIGLHLNESNNEERVTFYLGYTGLDDMSISGLLHSNDDGLNVGLNMSYIKERSIWYVEASVADKQSNLNEILTNISSDTCYTTELSLGLNYSSQSNIVSTLEYIYNAGGMDKNDWNTFFSKAQSIPFHASQLAQARGKLLSKSTMLSRHTLFVMARQSDALVNLDWNVLAWVNPSDKSSLLQMGLSYEYKEMVFSVDARAYTGGDQTEYGSYPNDYEGLVNMSYYF